MSFLVFLSCTDVPFCFREWSFITRYDQRRLPDVFHWQNIIKLRCSCLDTILLPVWCHTISMQATRLCEIGNYLTKLYVFGIYLLWKKVLASIKLINYTSTFIMTKSTKAINFDNETRNHISNTLFLLFYIDLDL